MNREEVIQSITAKMIETHVKIREVGIEVGGIVDVWCANSGESRIGTVTNVELDKAWRWEFKAIELSINDDDDGTKIVKVRSPNHVNAIGDDYYIIGGHNELPVDMGTVGAIAPRWLVSMIAEKIYGKADE